MWWSMRSWSLGVKCVLRERIKRIQGMMGCKLGAVDQRSTPKFDRICRSCISFFFLFLFSSFLGSYYFELNFPLSSPSIGLLLLLG